MWILILIVIAIVVVFALAKTSKKADEHQEALLMDHLHAKRLARNNSRKTK